MSIFIAGFEIDVAVTEEATLTSDITTFPIESGGTPSDHIRNLPEVLNIEAIVSDSPIDPVAGRRGPLGLPPFSIPSQDAYQFLVELRAKREPFTVICHLGVFDSMFVSDLSVPKDSREGIRFRGSFRKIDIIDTDRVFVAVPVKGKRGSKASKSSADIAEIAAGIVSPTTGKGMSVKEFRRTYDPAGVLTFRK